METIIEVAKQVPGLAVLVWLVTHFLKHLRDERASREKHESAWHALISSLGQDCHDHSKACVETTREALTESTAVIRENHRAIANITATLDALKARLQRHPPPRAHPSGGNSA